MNPNPSPSPSPSLEERKPEPWRCERLAEAVAKLREEPDPRQKDEWLAWRLTAGPGKALRESFTIEHTTKWVIKLKGALWGDAPTEHEAEKLLKEYLIEDSKAAWDIRIKNLNYWVHLADECFPDQSHIHSAQIDRHQAWLVEDEPDPRQKDEWLLWRVRKGDVSLGTAMEAWNARMKEWNDTWLKETGGHLE